MMHIKSAIKLVSASLDANVFLVLVKHQFLKSTTGIKTFKQKQKQFKFRAE